MDLATAQQKLDLWLAAEAAVASGQAYTIEGRSLTRANLAQITERIQYWQRVVDTLSAQAAGAASPGIRFARWT